MNKKEMISFCKKNNIKNFSNKSKDELKEHIQQFQLMKKYFRNFCNFGLIQQLELDNERIAIEHETVKRLNKDKGLNNDLLGDDFERMQVEQALEVSLLEMNQTINKDLNNDLNNDFLTRSNLL